MKNVQRQLVTAFQQTRNQLEREKLLLHFFNYMLPQFEGEQVKQLFFLNLRQLEETSEKREWLLVFHLLLLQENILSFVASKETESLQWKQDSNCQEESIRMAEICVSLARSSESRLRNLVGKLLGQLVVIFGTKLFDLVYSSIFEIAKESLLEAENSLEVSAVAEKSKHDVLSSSRNVNCLETSLETIANILSKQQEAHLNSILQDLVYFLNNCYTHSNRFVREACEHVIHSFLEKCSASDLVEPAFVDIIAKIISTGMEDNWSQVRFAASSSCRIFLERLEDQKYRYFSILLPRLRLNCHYVAEGVKSYNLESWKLLLKSKGLETLSQCSESFFDYYVSQTLAENHCVREAACHAMEEAIDRLPLSSVERHIQQVVQALLVCFQDESWPVRDSACVVCGTVTAKYPKQVQASVEMKQLVELWKDALIDNIPSVRENAAIALVKACDALDNHPLLNFDILLEHCSQLMLRVRDQPKNPEKYGVGRKETQFGVAHKLAHDNDKELHLEQTMYSCGSLAPKLKGGCSSDRREEHKKEPWEESDGALRLWRQLILKKPKEASKLVPTSMEIFQHLEFAKAPYLLDTFYSVMGDTMDYLEKESMMPYLELFMEQLQIAKTSDYPAVQKNAKITCRKLERRFQL
ncbi:hypothetical protein GAYE_SCF66G6854 [Galdieria yellowstonensis]|uniref:Uncharacterized protein n=1 Tax=Galdieria yellowstonensis TaxID=3028027 RepID=A0AAV9IP35_9RHOD|nr:hypothetical protein GAYE_SCF66G6854 [Galdieria yellowstonensis]